MLWFIAIFTNKSIITLKFKYILCYGSSPKRIFKFIHFFSFKYILCYGSSESPSSTRATISYLNTSYVMVHHQSGKIIILHYIYLNTSYVMVHHVVYTASPEFFLFKYILCYGSSRGRIPPNFYPLRI